MTGSPHRVGKSGKSRKFCVGREVGQGKKKYLKISCSYVLKPTSYLGLAVSAIVLDLFSPAHVVLPLLLLMEHLRPPTLPLPTTILLGTGAVVLGMQ